MGLLFLIILGCMNYFVHNVHVLQKKYCISNCCKYFCSWLLQKRAEPTANVKCGQKIPIGTLLLLCSPGSFVLATLHHFLANTIITHLNVNLLRQTRNWRPQPTLNSFCSNMNKVARLIEKHCAPIKDSFQKHSSCQT